MIMYPLLCHVMAMQIMHITCLLLATSKHMCPSKKKAQTKKSASQTRCSVVLCVRVCTVQDSAVCVSATPRLCFLFFPDTHMHTLIGHWSADSPAEPWGM